MPTNISKYVQLNDFLLLEYEFNRDGTTINLNKPITATNIFGTKQYLDTTALGITNNIGSLNSVPTNTQRTSWYNSSTGDYNSLWTDSSTITLASYKHDTIKVHLVSGYNFNDVGGFLLQIRAQDVSLNLVDLSNFTYINQSVVLGNSNVMKFALNTLYLGNRFYDKYIEFKVPSVQTLGSDQDRDPDPSTCLYDTPLGQFLKVNNGSDVYVTYSTIDTIQNNQFVINEIINLQLPVTSAADNFNAFIAESTSGDYIEYYATWNDVIIGNYISDIESGRIKLYTSNSPNDNYQSFVDTYGVQAAKWVLMHELYVYENIGATSSLLTQKFVFTQEDNFSYPNYFRPVLKNADIASSYTIQYVCRLMNRMDGTQIIRKAAFASTNPKKYGLLFTKLNINNIIPYKVFNKIEAEAVNNVTMTGRETNKYIKVFVDTTTITMNAFHEIYPQGTGPLFLKSGDSVYKFKFEKYDTKNNLVNVDLSGAYNYGLLFKLDDGTKIEVGPTYSTNMNTTIGEIEFKLTGDQINSLLKQTNNNYSIIIKNPDNTQYTYYEGKFFSYANFDQVMTNYNQLTTVSELNAKITDLETQVNALQAENAKLKTT